MSTWTSVISGAVLELGTLTQLIRAACPRHLVFVSNAASVSRSSRHFVLIRNLANNVLSALRLSRVLVVVGGELIGNDVTFCICRVTCVCK